MHERGCSQLSESWVPAPPSGYIHLLSGIPRCLAYWTEVKIQLAARLTLLNAFINKGSILNQSLSPEERATMSRACTRKANPPVLLRHSSDGFGTQGFLSVVPSKFILLSNLCKFCVHLSGLLVVLLNRLLAMSSEPVLIQCVDMDRKPNRMRNSYTCKAFRSVAFTRGCEKHLLSLRRESCKG